MAAPPSEHSHSPAPHPPSTRVPHTVPGAHCISMGHSCQGRHMMCVQTCRDKDCELTSCMACVRARTPDGAGRVGAGRGGAGRGGAGRGGVGRGRAGRPRLRGGEGSYPGATAGPRKVRRICCPRAAGCPAETSGSARPDAAPSLPGTPCAAAPRPLGDAPPAYWHCRQATAHAGASSSPLTPGIRHEQLRQQEDSDSGVQTASRHRQKRREVQVHQCRCDSERKMCVCVCVDSGGVGGVGGGEPELRRRVQKYTAGHIGVSSACNSKPPPVSSTYRAKFVVGKPSSTTAVFANFAVLALLRAVCTWWWWWWRRRRQRGGGGGRRTQQLVFRVGRQRQTLQHRQRPQDERVEGGHPAAPSPNTRHHAAPPRPARLSLRVRSQGFKCCVLPRSR